MKRYRNFIAGTLCLLLFISIFILMTNHWLVISESENDIDQLDNMLKEIKEILPGNANISFYTNCKNNLELNFKSQFVLAPMIVTDNVRWDTILMIVNTAYSVD